MRGTTEARTDLWSSEPAMARWRPAGLRGDEHVGAWEERTAVWRKGRVVQVSPRLPPGLVKSDGTWRAGP